VAISGTKVLLTLASPVVYGNVVTVAYTKPATNPLQTAEGGQAATITAQSVINSVDPAYLKQVTIYPNPANELINIRIYDPIFEPDFIRIIDLFGKILVKEKINSNIKELQIFINLPNGIYIVLFEKVNSIIFTQKLVVSK
jgi:hypothetical protein